MFRSNKSGKNSVLSSSSRCTPVPQVTSKAEDIKVEEVSFATQAAQATAQDSNVPIIKSGAHRPSQSSRNHPGQVSGSITPQAQEDHYSNVVFMRSNSDAAPNSPPSRQSKVTPQQQQQRHSTTSSNAQQQQQQSSVGSSNQASAANKKHQLKGLGDSNRSLKSNKSNNQAQGSKQGQNAASRIQSKVGSFAEKNSQKSNQNASQTQQQVSMKVQTQTALNNTQQIPSTLDPANPLAHTTSTRAKKLATKERISIGAKSSQGPNFSQASNATTPKMQLSVKTSLPTSSHKSFKMYATLQHSNNSFKSVSRNHQASPSGSALNRRKTINNSPRYGSRTSMGSKDQEAAIIHSQAMIQRSRDQRLNSSGRVALMLDPEHAELENSPENPTMLRMPQAMACQASPTAASNALLQSQNSQVTFEESMRDEMVYQLRSQLEDERKKHREMKSMFDEAVSKMESQNRHIPSEEIQLQTNKAVDEILNKGALSQTVIRDELEKQKQLIAELKQKESDMQSQTQILEKQLLHAQMREKESQAKEQIRVLQQETAERKMHIEVEKLKEQVKDLRNNEEQLKSDHAQTILELNDQIEEVRSRQQAESEEQYMKQIHEIKQVHAREREVLVQQKFAATQELQMIKMDHSELIRNTNFEEQRDLVETITAQQAQIQHLTVLLGEQQSNFELKQSQMSNDKKGLEAKVAQLEALLSNVETAKENLEKEMGKKCKDLEAKLDKATQDKDKVYKSQMEKIQSNLESLKEQITSTNQSLIDQSIGVAPYTEQSALMNNVVARLHSPDFHNTRHRRGDPIGCSSPRVPRAFANLDSRGPVDQQRRMQSPVQALASSRLRDKSSDQQNIQRIFSGSEMHDLTQLMSNGTHEQTINLGPQTAGQALFNHTVNHQNVGAPNQNSFLLDPVFNDYYVEYVMLHKLKSLTNNFTCQTCWQVLNFARFFDEDHECLHRVGVPSQAMINEQMTAQGRIGHSQLESDSIEEFKEARAMFGPSEGQSRLQNATDESVERSGQASGAPILSGPSRQESASSQAQQLRQRGSSAVLKRGSIKNLPSLMKQAATTGVSTVMVTEINLGSRKETLEGDGQPVTTGSFQHQPASNGDLSMDGGEANQQRRNTVYTQKAPAINTRHKVNSMQLEVYVQKIKEYRVKIQQLEGELKKCHSENDSLIDDLRDTKTKVAVLEESKAQLQMEITKLRKQQVKGSTRNNNNGMVTQRSPKTPQLNVTVNTQSYGVFGLGGKSQMSIQVPPALTKSQKVGGGASGSVPPQPEEIKESALTTQSDMKVNMTPRNRFNRSDEKLRSKNSAATANQNVSKAIFRSPQTRMVPLSQKFSAFPTSEFKARANIGGPNAPSTIFNQTRNRNAMELSIQSGSAHLASRSFNNLTMKLNSSVQHLRGGRQTARPEEESSHYQHQQRQQMDFLKPPGRDISPGNESCDISPENDGSIRRHNHHAQRYGGANTERVAEDNEADLSSMNPLVTPGVDVTENRVSLFEANQRDSANKHHQNYNRDYSPDGGAEIELTRSQPMIKLNNPYDQVSIQRQLIMSEDSPTTPGGDYSRPTGGETRRTITPGMTKHKKSVPVDMHRVTVKNAVPIKRLALEQIADQQEGTMLQQLHGSGAQGAEHLTVSQLTSQRKTTVNDEPFRMDEL